MERKITTSYVTIVKNDREGLFKTLSAFQILRHKHNIELIVVDGNSNDLSLVDTQAISELSDVFISEPDCGIYHAMNKGWRVARGEFIGYINAGDVPINEGIVKLLQSIDANIDVVYGAVVVFDEQDIDINVIAFHHRNLPNGTVTHPGTLVRREIYHQLNGFDENFKIAGDREFFIRLSKLNFNFLFVSTFVVNFRSGGLSSSFKCTKENLKIDLKYSNSGKGKFIFKYFISYSYYLFNLLLRKFK